MNRVVKHTFKPSTKLNICVFVAVILMLGMYHPFIKTMNQYQPNEAHTYRTVTQPAPARTVEISKVPSINTDKSSEVAAKKTDKTFEVTAKRTDKSSEVAAKKTDKSSEVAAKKTDKSSEVTAKKFDKISEVAAKKTDKSSEMTAEKTDKSSEVAAKKTDKTSEVTAKRTDKSSEVAAKKTDKSSEVAAKKTDKFSEITAEKTDKSSEVAAKKTDKSSEVAAKKTDKSSEVAAKKTDKSSEVLSKKTSKAEVSAINSVSEDSNKSKTPEQCYHDYLGPTQADDLAKIESYKFEGIEKYIKDLFTSNISDTQFTGIQKYPTFVSGISSNHFNEGLVMLEELNKTVMTKYKEVNVILFDLGLTQFQLKQLNESGLCKIRTFRYDLYPEHVKKLHNFAWKAIVIQTVAKETPFVIWVDASVRFRTGDLDGLFKKIRENGLVVTYLGKTRTGTVAERTHLKTFEFLDEKPCTFALHHETWATIIPLYANPFIIKYFLYPFVACALSLGCMEPFPGGSDKFLKCPGNRKPYQYHLCHRSDQSTLGILFYRLFHMEIEKHKLDLNYIRVCRSTQRMCNGF